MGKLRDLITLVLIGVSCSSRWRSPGWSAGSPRILDWAGLSADLELAGHAAHDRARPARQHGAVPHDVPAARRAAHAAPSLWSGALLGAVGFEILKQLSGLLLGSPRASPAFQAFGIALILLVWINYSSRVILYAAAWAWTHPLAAQQRVVEPADPVQGPPLPSMDELPDDPTRTRSHVRVPSWRGGRRGRGRSGDQEQDLGDGS